jgi:hypothetical protein
MKIKPLHPFQTGHFSSYRKRVTIAAFDEISIANIVGDKIRSKMKRQVRRKILERIHVHYPDIQEQADHIKAAI